MLPLFDPELGSRISDCGIVAVLILDRVEDAVQVARSLVAGGINAIELTFRTPAALEALKEVRAKVPEMDLPEGTRAQVLRVNAERPANPRKRREVWIVYGDNIAVGVQYKYLQGE